jgi:hypothetical protein
VFAQPKKLILPEFTTTILCRWPGKNTSFAAPNKATELEKTLNRAARQRTMSSLPTVKPAP